VRLNYYPGKVSEKEVSEQWLTGDLELRSTEAYVSTNQNSFLRTQGYDSMGSGLKLMYNEMKTGIRK